MRITETMNRPNYEELTLILVLCAFLKLAAGQKSPEDQPIYLDISSVQINPSSVSCGSGQSISTCPLIDRNTDTEWQIPEDSGASINMKFLNDSSIVNRVLLHHNITSPSGLKIIITLKGDNITWENHIVENCRDFSPSSSNAASYNCYEFGEFNTPGVYEIQQKGQLLYRLTNGTLVWWERLNEIQLQFMKNNSINDSGDSAQITVRELQLFGWEEPASTCNCHPVGVWDPRAPCNESGVCQCNLLFTDSSSSQCVPTFVSGVSYGPIDGGTRLLFVSNVNMSAGITITITIGGGKNCQNPSSRTDNVVVCKTPAGDLSDMNKSLPMSVCWTINSYGTICRRLSQRFQYRPTPIISSVAPKKSFSFGGIPQTVTGQNLDSVVFPTVSLAIYNVGGNYITDTYYTDNSNQIVVCDVKSGTQMICPTPVLRDQVYTETLQKYYLQISMDGGKYSNASTFDEVEKAKFKMSMFGHIQFQMFGTKYYDPDNNPKRMFDILTEVETQWVLSGATPSDYSVTVGGEPAARVIAAATNVVQFQPPLREPSASSLDLDGGRMVKLAVGYNVYTAGYIKYGKPGKDKVPLIVGLCVGLGGAALLALIIAALIIKWRRQRRIEEDLITKRPTRSNPYSERRSPPMFPTGDSSVIAFIGSLPDDIRSKVGLRPIDYKNLRRDRLVGKGNFGQVFKGTLSNDDGSTEIVAIKTLLGCEEGLDYTKKVEFLREAVIMIEFSHQNVLSLKGIAFDNQNQSVLPCVVLPFMENGDLKTYISNRNNNLSVAMLLKFGLQVAEGMEYLSQKQYIHRDLAARNCMIDRKSVVKVADFGFARDVFQDQYYRPRDHNRPLPIKWMAIESLTNYMFTIQSDIWSYGVVLWELITRGKKPYPNVDMDYMVTYLRQGNRLPKPDLAPDEVYDIMCACWHLNPEDRPSFTEIKNRLKAILESSGHENPVETRDPPSNYAGTTERNMAVNSYLELSVAQAVSNDYLTTEATQSDSQPSQNYKNIP